MQLVHISIEVKTKESDLEHVYIYIYPKNDKLRNPKIDYTAIGFHKRIWIPKLFFSHIAYISKVKSIHKLNMYTGLKSVI